MTSSRLAIALWLVCISAQAQEGRISGFELMGPELQQMQQDDMANPGMLWVGEGADLWGEPAGEAQTSCANCHGAAETEMAGVAARYPAFDEALGRPVDLPERVNLCRTRHQGTDPLPRESRDVLALTAFVARQSRGMPIVSDDPRLVPWRKMGGEIFATRMGQLNLSCAICHDDLAGSRLAAATIPQAHPVGYPQYRLQWQELGSLQRRLRNCMTGMRAEPFADGSEEYLALEVYLADRAAGLAVEAPSVRP